MLCCLDSGSEVNLASRYLLHDVHHIAFEGVSNCGSETVFHEQGTLVVFVEDSIRRILALVANEAQLPFECGVLLGVPGLDHLGVQLDSHQEGKRKPIECHVEEKTLRTRLDANGANTVTKVSFEISEIDVNPDLPANIQARVRDLLQEYHGVVAGQQDSLPKPFVAEPIELKFVPNPQPILKASPSRGGPSHKSRSSRRGQRGRSAQWLSRAVHFSLVVQAAHRHEDACAYAQGFGGHWEV